MNCPSLVKVFKIQKRNRKLSLPKLLIEKYWRFVWRQPQQSISVAVYIALYPLCSHHAKMFKWCAWSLILKWSEMIGLDHLSCPSSWGMWATAKCWWFNYRYQICQLLFIRAWSRHTMCCLVKENEFFCFRHALFYACWTRDSNADSPSGTQTLVSGGHFWFWGVQIPRKCDAIVLSSHQPFSRADLTRRCRFCFGSSRPRFCSAAAAAQFEEPDPVSQ